MTDARAGTVAAASAADISLLQIVNALLRHTGVVIGLPVLAAIVVGGIALLLPKSYTAATSFVPEASAQSRLPSGLQGLAGQFGLSLGAQTTESPRFYAAVLRSRELMERVLLARYPVGVGSDSATLLQVLRIGGRDRADSLTNGVRKLDRLLTVTADNATNIVRLETTASSPRIASDMGNRFVAFLNEFNTRKRQTQAGQRRRFVEAQLAEGQRDLQGAEENLRTFYERNRSWQQSPQLVFEEGRLRRQVEIRQEVYLTLRREFETAKIEEVNDTPVITVIDPAVPPRRKSKPKPVLLAALAFCMTGLAAVTWVAGAEYLERLRREGTGEYEEFSGILTQVRERMRVSRSAS